MDSTERGSSVYQNLQLLEEVNFGSEFESVWSGHYQLPGLDMNQGWGEKMIQHRIAIFLCGDILLLQGHNILIKLFTIQNNYNCTVFHIFAFS